MDRDLRRGRAFAIALGTILAVGAVLRTAAPGLHSFWFDEVNAMRIARAPDLASFAERLARIDMVGSPLHPLLLRWWTDAWGTSEAASRGLSAAFSVLGLGAFAAASWLAFRSRAATLAATALMAVCPLDAAYAMEGRMYSLLTFWTVAAWGLLFSFRSGRSPGREAAFGLCLVGLAYTHPLGGLMVAALALGYLVDARRSTLSIGRWVVVQAAAFAAVLPWLGRYVDHPPDPKQAADSAQVLLHWAALGLGWPWWAFVAVAAAVATAWFAPVRGREVAPIEGDDRRTAIMLAIWAACPVAMMAAYSWLRHPIMGPLRYHLFLMPGVILLIAGAVARSPKVVGVLVAACALAFTPRALVSDVFDPQRKPDWRDAARATIRRAHDPVVVLSAREPHMYYQTVDYYLPPGTPILSIEEYRSRLAAGTLDRSREYWLFHDSRDFRTDRAKFPARPEAGLDFGRLTVRRLDPRPDATAGLAPLLR